VRSGYQELELEVGIAVDFLHQPAQQPVLGTRSPHDAIFRFATCLPQRPAPDAAGGTR